MVSWTQDQSTKAIRSEDDDNWERPKPRRSLKLGDFIPKVSPPPGLGGQRKIKKQQKSPWRNSWEDLIASVDNNYNEMMRSTRWMGITRR